MSRWFRLYDEFLDDPKIQRLHPGLLKVLLNIWCVASRHDGCLPSQADLSFSLRMTEDETFRAVSKLMEAGFIDTDPATGEQRPHGWESRQYRSDSSTDRVREHRKRQKSANQPHPLPPNGGFEGNGDETFHGTAPDTEQIQRQNSPANAGAVVVLHPALDFKKAVFDAGKLHLMAEDPELTDRRAGGIIGGWRAKLRNDAVLLEIMNSAEARGASVFLEYVSRAVENHHVEPGRSSRREGENRTRNAAQRVAERFGITGSGDEGETGPAAARLDAGGASGLPIALLSGGNGRG